MDFVSDVTLEYPAAVIQPDWICIFAILDFRIFVEAETEVESAHEIWDLCKTRHSHC